MRKLISSVAIVAAVLLVVSARAGAQTIGTVSEEPGATLLLPYFEVDLGSSSGRTTRFSINNASASAILAHVTVWSDLAVPVLAFNVYLTGYDLQTIDMRNIMNGTLPQTASAGQDPNDTISPKGPDSQDINFASCTGQFPLPQLPQIYIDHIRNSLTGKFTNFYDACAGTVSGNLARGYVTVDTVNNCTLRFHDDPNYILNDITFQNVLWGDFSYVNSGFAFQGAPLVSIVASLTNPAVTTAGRYTFYGRYDSWSAADHRNPLATTFAGRYIRNSTLALAWRDPKVAQGPFTCGFKPSWYPLGQEGFAIFDDKEHVQVPVSFPVAPQPPNPGIIPFPAATQKTLIGSTAFPVSFQNGWIYYDLNTTVSGVPDPPVDPAAAQAWVMLVRPISAGTFGNIGLVGGAAFQLDTAVAANHFLP